MPPTTKVEAKVPNEYVFDFYFGDASDLSGSPRPRSFLLGAEKGSCALGAFTLLVRVKSIMENIVANVRVETTEELLAMVNDELRAMQLDRKDPFIKRKGFSLYLLFQSCHGALPALT